MAQRRHIADVWRLWQGLLLGREPGLGILMAKLENRRLGSAAFDALVSAADGQPLALALLAAKALEGGDAARARVVAGRAMALAPSDPEVVAIASAVVAADVPMWHFHMMRDETRNAAYEAAIARAVRPGMRVLDVGAGSGLLAMMAVRAGAASVVSCEMDGAVAGIAREIVARNGFADRITIINAHSGDLDAERDLGGPVDLVVSEIIGKDVVCERVLPSLRDVARRLLKPGGTMIPLAAEVRVALAYWQGYEDIPALPDQCGFDLTPFNRLQPPRWSMSVGDRRLALRSGGGTLMRFDLASGAAADVTGSIMLDSSGGPANGVVQWARLQLDDHGWFENHPGHGARSSWACQFFPFGQSIDTIAGQPVRIGGRVVTDRLRIWKGAD